MDLAAITTGGLRLVEFLGLVGREIIFTVSVGLRVVLSRRDVALGILAVCVFLIALALVWALARGFLNSFLICFLLACRSPFRSLEECFRDVVVGQFELVCPTIFTQLSKRLVY